MAEGFAAPEDGAPVPTLGNSSSATATSSQLEAHGVSHFQGWGPGPHQQKRLFCICNELLARSPLQQWQRTQGSGKALHHHYVISLSPPPIPAERSAQALPQNWDQVLPCAQPQCWESGLRDSPHCCFLPLHCLIPHTLGLVGAWLAESTSSRDHLPAHV